MNLVVFRARLICMLRYKDYLHYASLAHSSVGQPWDYYERLAREHRARAREAAFIASGEFPPYVTYTAPEVAA